MHRALRGQEVPYGLDAYDLLYALTHHMTKLQGAPPIGVLRKKYGIDDAHGRPKYPSLTAPTLDQYSQERWNTVLHYMVRPKYVFK